MKGRIHGVSVYMKSFDFFFGLLLGEFILKHSDNLSKTLQTMAMSAAEAQKIAQMTVRTLQSVRNAEKFVLFWTKVTTMASAIGVDDPADNAKHQESMAQQKERLSQMFKHCIDLSFLKHWI